MDALLQYQPIQRLGPQGGFSYPMPPYMSLRLSVRREVAFAWRPRTLMNMVKRFEWRDLVHFNTMRNHVSTPGHIHLEERNRKKEDGFRAMMTSGGTSKAASKRGVVWSHRRSSKERKKFQRDILYTRSLLPKISHPLCDTNDSWLALNCKGSGSLLVGKNTNMNDIVSVDIYDQTNANRTGVAVSLEIKNNKCSRYFCCEKSDPPTLELMKKKPEELDQITKDLEKFIFFQSNNESFLRFESATNNNWFISINKKQVTMSHKDNQQAVLEFKDNSTPSEKSLLLSYMEEKMATMRRGSEKTDVENVRDPSLGHDAEGKEALLDHSDTISSGVHDPETEDEPEVGA